MNKLKLANISIKVILVGLLTHYLLNGDLPQYQNKGMHWRVIGYPLVCFAILILYSYRLWIYKKKINYPGVIDLLLTFVITFDMLGNTLDFYNSIEVWDDLMHLLLSIPWVVAIGHILKGRYSSTPRNITGIMAFGLGAASHVVWEIAEYLTFVPNNPIESQSAYRDTIGDLGLSLIGSLIGAIIIGKFLDRRVSKLI